MRNSRLGCARGEICFLFFFFIVGDTPSAIFNKRGCLFVWHLSLGDEHEENSIRRYCSLSSGYFCCYEGDLILCHVSPHFAGFAPSLIFSNSCPIYEAHDTMLGWQDGAPTPFCWNCRHARGYGVFFTWSPNILTFLQIHHSLFALLFSCQVKHCWFMTDALRHSTASLSAQLIHPT